MVPDRVDGTGFAATVNPTLASPWPLRSPFRETQLVLVAIVQVQSRDVLMVTVPVPPLAPNEAGDVPATTWHFVSAVGPAMDVSAELHADRQEPAMIAKKMSKDRMRSTPRTLNARVSPLGKQLPTRCG